MMIKSLLLITGLLLFHFSALSQIEKEKKACNYFSQGNSNRTAAEWEPAKGTMIVWPLSVPYKLVVELAKDNHLYTLVANDSTKIEAQKWYNQWGINSSDNTFIHAPQGVDSWWTRDWGPNAVFTNDKTMKLGDGKYIYSTPATKIGCNDSLMFLYVGKNNEIIETKIDDNATIPLAKALNLDVLDLPFINTGGNVLTDGLRSAFSTCIILNENRFYNVNQDKFFGLNSKLLGFEHYNIVSNFEKIGIQHIDCFMKLLDEERILVAEPPANHELHPIYENIIEDELKKIKTFYGRGYEIVRLKTDRYNGEKLAAYTNSIIVNKTVYVPLYQIKADSLALETWRKVMPGYTVKGFTFALADEPLVSKEMKEHYKSGYGWNNGDALHCRTRAIWDNEMLFITTKKIDNIVSSRNKNIVYSTIIDYSKKGLVKDKCQIFWRVLGEKKWITSQLRPDKNHNHFFYEIPYHKKGATVEYFISVESKSGKKETQPRTAPLGTYQFRIE